MDRPGLSLPKHVVWYGQIDMINSFLKLDVKNDEYLSDSVKNDYVLMKFLIVRIRIITKL